MKLIYGFPEEVWVKVLESTWSSGEEDSAFIASILRKYNITLRSKILDLGCGIGRIAIRLALIGYKVLGIDISPLCIKKAYEYAMRYNVEDKVILEVGDYNRLKEIDSVEKYKPFDAALLILTLTWSNTKEVISFFKNINDIVKDKGILIIQDPCREFYTSILTYTPFNSFKWIDEKTLCMTTRRLDHSRGMVSVETWIYKKVSNEELKLIKSIRRKFYTPTLREYIEVLKDANWKVVEVVHRHITRIEPIHLHRCTYISPYVIAVKQQLE